MSIFDDEKYESLDWISKAVEPIHYSLTDTLSNMPSEVEITVEDILSQMRESGLHQIYKDDILSMKVKEYRNLHHYEKSILANKCFLFSNEDNIELNTNTKTMSGSIKLIKTKETFDDRELAEMMGQIGLNYIRSELSLDGDRNISRLKEVAEIVGKCDKVFKTRSKRSMRLLFINRLVLLMKNNEWNIRDIDLSNKLIKWISDYITTGNLAAMSNFCKLKVMTHSNTAIYSVKEEIL